MHDNLLLCFSFWLLLKQGWLKKRVLASKGHVRKEELSKLGKDQMPFSVLKYAQHLKERDDLLSIKTRPCSHVAIQKVIEGQVAAPLGVQYPESSIRRFVQDAECLLQSLPNKVIEMLFA